ASTAPSLLRNLLVVLLTRDAAALLVLRFFDARALFLRHLAVRHRLVFHFLDARLALLQPRRFLLGQLSGLHALVDPLLLVLLALVDARGAGGLRKSRDAQRGKCGNRDEFHGFHGPILR